MAPLDLQVREMQPYEVEFRIDYFHDASDEHLQLLGVESTECPQRRTEPCTATSWVLLPEQ